MTTGAAITKINFKIAWIVVETTTIYSNSVDWLPSLVFQYANLKMT